jgi:hypothetical protein
VQVDGKAYDVVGVDERNMNIKCVRLGLDSNAIFTFRIEQCKLMLRKMDEMTAEERENINRLRLIQKVLEKDEPWVITGYLNKYNIDYRGLIDKGLAVHCLL